MDQALSWMSDHDRPAAVAAILFTHELRIPQVLTTNIKVKNKMDTVMTKMIFLFIPGTLAANQVVDKSNKQKMYRIGDGTTDDGDRVAVAGSPPPPKQIHIGHSDVY